MAGRMSAHSLQVGELFDAVVLLYLRLSALSARIHGGGALSGPRRTVLVGLSRTGPQTVAQMARVRAQSRQRFQPLVNALISDGLVRAIPNPAHKQSSLIELTQRGRRAVARIHAIECAGRARVGTNLSAQSLSRSLAVLRSVTADIEREIAALDRQTR
jgi:DNA-binding MarR family transcriptional regulator